MVSVREIFLNDEHDLDLSNTIYEQYLDKIMEVEQDLDKLRLQADISQGKDKKELTDQIKETEKTVAAMRTARKSMLKFQSAFEAGSNAAESETAHQKARRKSEDNR